MPRGAGHDAQDMALITPTGMIFVPSVKGIRHSPKEFTSAEDMANGVSVLLRTVLEIDGGGLERGEQRTENSRVGGSIPRHSPRTCEIPPECAT